MIVVTAMLKQDTVHEPIDITKQRVWPRADIGVLLAHGIGEHKEGETLTSFGEPLIDWVREWLRTKSEPGREAVVVSAARVRATRNEAESPAYALMTLHGPSKQNNDSTDETWLFCEAWWGDSVQPPMPLKLLKWLWSRGPLLIFWHFYLKITASDHNDSDEASQKDALRAVIAFLLAASCQLVVAVALLLWLIPIGQWRRSVASAVRTLTLTLGDSYVLLENDIQRAALVQRVQRTLAWLPHHCDEVVVLAHSQGGAIAHEALTHAYRRKVSAFISVGSGLEKLQFLRRVRERRKGVFLSSLVAPVIGCGASLTVFGLSSYGKPWEVGVGAVLLIVGLWVVIGLTNTLDSYRSQLLGKVDQLKLTITKSEITWTNIAASHDLVPVVEGSLISNQSFVHGMVTTNERSYWTDHTGYFKPYSSSLTLIWQALGAVSSVQLFRASEIEAQKRFSQLHLWYARTLMWSRRSTYAAIILLLAFFSNSMVAFGGSLLTRVDGSPLDDILKPVRFLAGALAWLIQLIWAPQTAVSEVLAQGLVGALVLVGAMALWTTAFLGIWRASAVARWRYASRGSDVLHNRSSWIESFARCSLMFALGELPLIFVGVMIVAPQTLSMSVIGDALGAIVAALCVIVSLTFALSGPRSWLEVRAGQRDPDWQLTLLPLPHAHGSRHWI